MILVLCQRGNVRSATTAVVLRDCYGYVDVVATGVETTSSPLMNALCDLADTVIIVGDGSLEDKFRALAPNREFIRLDVGKDKWGMPMHPDLVKVIISRLDKVFVNSTGPFYGSSKNYLDAVRAIWQQVKSTI